MMRIKGEYYQRTFIAVEIEGFSGEHLVDDPDFSFFFSSSSGYQGHVDGKGCLCSVSETSLVPPASATGVPRPTACYKVKRDELWKYELVWVDYSRYSAKTKAIQIVLARSSCNSVDISENVFWRRTLKHSFIIADILGKVNSLSILRGLELQNFYYVILGFGSGIHRIKQTYKSWIIGSSPIMTPPGVRV